MSNLALLLGCVFVALSVVCVFGQPPDSVSVQVNPAPPRNSALDALLPVVAGFVLTTLIGGVVAHWLQVRSWRFQREETLRDLHQSEATKIFDEVSRLLDQRHYRMSLVRWALAREPFDQAHVDRQWKRYRAVVFKWNDSVNRNRALIGRFFGRKASRRFELEIGERFVQYGKLLERCYREGRPADHHERQTLESMSDTLNGLIWQFDDECVEQIRAGHVGAFLKNEASESAPS